MDFIEKLDYLLKVHHLNKTQFSKKANIPYPTITSWYKKGTSQIPRSRLLEIAKFFNVSLDFLCDDSIDVSTYEKHLNGQTILRQYNDQVDPKILETYNSLNDARKMQVHEYIDLLHLEQNTKEEVACEVFPQIQNQIKNEKIQKFLNENNIETIEKIINMFDNLK